MQNKKMLKIIESDFGTLLTLSIKGHINVFNLLERNHLNFDIFEPSRKLAITRLDNYFLLRHTIKKHTYRLEVKGHLYYIYKDYLIGYIDLDNKLSYGVDNFYNHFDATMPPDFTYTKVSREYLDSTLLAALLF